MYRTDAFARLQKLRTLPAKELAARAGYKMLTTWERSWHGRQRPDQREHLARAVTGTPRQSALRIEWLLARRRDKRAAGGSLDSVRGLVR